MRKISEIQEAEIVEKYKVGGNCRDLSVEYGLGKRQVERICKKHGVTRTRSESFKLAIKQGRMRYYRKPDHLKVGRRTLSPLTRHEVMIRDKFRCVLCGSKQEDGIRIEVDHIDEDRQNSAPENLQTLCDPCNKGKAYNSPKWKEYQEEKRKFYKKAVE